MVIYLKAGGELRAKLKPDVDHYTRRVETEVGKSLAEILTGIGINPSFVAFAFKNGTLKRLDHIPSDGDIITLQPPVSGG
jgi:molybdopterin converting factor small subunit